MNKELIRILSMPITEESKMEALRIISKSDIETMDIFGFVENQSLVTNVTELAAGYVSSGAAAVSRQKTWEMMIGTTDIANGLSQLLKNVSLINYTQAVMIVTMAIMED